ncbi:MAG TPA: hypothetical protein VGJ60_19315 [Chloroflexota bacterium]|jgi:hypothetical protein
MQRHAKLNRVQALVLTFLALAWLSLVAILAIAPDVYDGSLGVPPGDSSRPAELLFLFGISALIVFIAIGVVLRWRWIFWLLLLAFIAGILRVPASVLELAGWIPANGPSWYVVFQALLGLVQFTIGVVMLSAYRRYGTWGHRT